MHSLTRRKINKFIWITLPYFITFLLWVFAKIELRSELTFGETPRLISQVFALIGLIMLSQNYLLSTRMSIIESIYGGLDKIYFTHKLIGKVSLFLIIIHPVLLILYYYNDFSTIATLIVPFLSSGSIPKTLGIIGLWGYIILISITIFRFLPYHIWKLTHNLIGLPFLAAGAHGLLAQSDARYFLPLKLWISFWILIGVASYVYKLLLYHYWGPKYRYVVEGVNELNNVGELILRPKDKRMNFEPGEFVFVSFKNNEWIKSEHHPFSISSSPSKEFLRISYKDLGDYTNSLRHAKPGDRVDVYGPYGEFTSYVFSPYKKQIWIAGGIGVTPFLSMLEYEVQNSDKKDIHFYYCGRESSDFVYDQEIKTTISKADDNIEYRKFSSKVDGRLTAHKLLDDIGDVSEYLVLICGPTKMMKSLRKQLISIGIDKDLIVFEEFSFGS